MSTKPRLITTVSAMLIVVVLVIVGITTKAQTGQTNTQIILNLLNGQQYFGVPHVYLGYYGSPTNQWPVYYGPNNASQYWSQGGISSDQPVLELTPAQTWSTGAMFWSETYSGGVVKITIIGTYTKGSPLVGNGFVIYLFLKPTMWGISPNYNYSYSIVFEYLLPQSSTPYIGVAWNPYWQFGYRYSGATGQWSVGLVTNPNGNNSSVGPYPSPNLGSPSSGWDGIGTGAFQPNPGDLIKITVTYDPSNNTLSGIAYDMNTSQTASFTLSLNGYFTPPSNGNYVFGVGAVTDGDYANWALLYASLNKTMGTAPQPGAAETVIFFDDFESYDVGTFPSSGGWTLVWDGAGSQYQVVTSSHYHSPSKSLQLLGAYGWSSVAEKRFSTAARIIGFEAYMMAESYPQNPVSTYASVGSVGFWNRDEATWGKYYVTVEFRADGYLVVHFINDAGAEEDIEL